MDKEKILSITIIIMIILVLSPMRFEPCPLNWQNRATTTNLTLLINNSDLFYNSPIFHYFILYYFYVYLYMLVCDYLSLGVFSWVFMLEGYFSNLVSKGDLVIS